MIHVVYPEIPPSSNHLYYAGRGGVLQLTKVATEYGERFAHHMVMHHGHEISDLDPEALYLVRILFFFETVVNEGWLKRDKSGARKAKSRYKKMDLSNRIKLIEDCTRDAIAIDDSQTFAMMLEKHHSPQNPHVEIIVAEVDPLTFGVPLEYLMK